MKLETNITHENADAKPLTNNCGFCGTPIFEHQDFCSNLCEKMNQAKQRDDQITMIETANKRSDGYINTYKRGGEFEIDTAANTNLSTTNDRSIEGKVMAVNHDKGTIRIVVEVPARVKIGESVMVTFKHGQLHRVVRYIGATDDQVRFGGCDDPRGLLVEGFSYEITKEEVHTWHTKYELVGFDGKLFNSVSFELC